MTKDKFTIRITGEGTIGEIRDAITVLLNELNDDNVAKEIDYDEEWEVEDETLMVTITKLNED